MRPRNPREDCRRIRGSAVPKTDLATHISVEILSTVAQLYSTIRYDTRCYFNVRSKADISQLNLPHGNKYRNKFYNKFVRWTCTIHNVTVT